ncbi:MAG: DegT/DnrJ/EryC1/StrS aminotransferase family protein [Deltaproteobacteria bacterium]|nr:DegT/DnrJ/EryC1/StrS aminotransferase family protein [Deltaproteobacteria bacterium]
MIPRLRPPFTAGEVVTTFRTGTFQDIAAFETAFGELFGFPRGLYFPYGRAALYVLLRVLGWTEREIVIPAYTCAVVSHAVVLTGNRPRFGDCSPHHFNMPADHLAAQVSDRTAMIIPTPVFGYPVDEAEYARVLTEQAPGAFVLFDAAHSFALPPKSSPLFHRPDAALFGLGLGKIMSTLYGGMLLLRDRDLHREVQAYRDGHFQVARPAAEYRRLVYRLVYGLAAWAAFREPWLTPVDYLEQKTSLLNCFTKQYYGLTGPSLPDDMTTRPPQFQAGLGLSQLAKYDKIIAERRRLSRHYARLLQADGFGIFDHQVEPTYSHFPLRVAQRTGVLQELQRRGIQAGRLIDYACPDLPGYEAFQGSCPNASRLARSLINLPNWPGLGLHRVERVVTALIKIRQKFPEYFL